MVVLIIACTLWFLILGALGIANSSENAALLIVAVIIFTVFDAFMIDCCMRNYVDFHENFLEARLSIFSETVPYSKITCIKETDRLQASLSATAVSLDRLQLQYGLQTYILVAVKDKEGFLAEIIKRNPRIRVERKTAGKDEKQKLLF